LQLIQSRLLFQAPWLLLLLVATALSTVKLPLLIGTVRRDGRAGSTSFAAGSVWHIRTAVVHRRKLVS
jgi:hypothetical protein